MVPIWGSTSGFQTMYRLWKPGLNVEQIWKKGSLLNSVDAESQKGQLIHFEIILTLVSKVLST